MSTLNLAPASVEDYRREAEQKLPPGLFGYLDGGSYAERTLADNVADFEKLKLRQRVMCNVSALDTGTDLLGRHWSMPLALAPVGMAGMMARRAEVQAKRAADAAGIPFTLSTVSICSMEEVAAVSTVPFWFQLYMLRDRGAVSDLLQRALACGVRTLVFTVDLAVLGSRYRDIRNGLSGGLGPWGRLRAGLLSYLTHPRWLLEVGIRGGPHRFGNLSAYVPDATSPEDFRAWIDRQVDPSVTWKDIEWLASQWPGDLLIKGVLTPDDARAAVASGANGVIVSNHGGRQLDGVASTISVLPRVADTLADESLILVDSGVRTGQDLLKARALGAHGALCGRPWVYALAARGQSGLQDWLGSVQQELNVSMALTGCTDMNTVDGSVLDFE